MKKRRTAIIAFLLLAVCTLSIGYAALADYLVVKGDMEANTKIATDDFDADVYFTAASIEMHKADDVAFTAPEGVVCSATVINPDTVNVTANAFGGKGDHAVVTLTVKNDNAHAVKVSLDDAGSLNLDGDAFQVTTGALPTVPAGETATFEVIITLNVAPTGETLARNFTLQLKAEQ
ncbi:MAG: hypothetical protein J6R40_05355, partial [Clostridia bacterium]|nr:hypothetical protein [Clostridia bacterium]